MYKQGIVYIWQNLPSKVAYLNGTETVVTSEKLKYKNKSYWTTDTLTYDAVEKEEYFLLAEPGLLREKYPSSGERTILEMFKQPELTPA